MRMVLRKIASCVGEADQAAEEAATEQQQANLIAILGLRALYFALAAMVHRFHYLKYALAVLLVFIGSKIFVADALGLAKVPPPASLGITFAILAAGVGHSLWKTRGKEESDWPAPAR
jgi:predicted tellurium resistance membrane protein TerC